MNKIDKLDMLDTVQEILLSDINLVLYNKDYEDYIVAKKKMLSDSYMKKLQSKLKDMNLEPSEDDFSAIQGTVIPLLKDKFSKLNESNYSTKALSVQIELSALIQSFIERMKNSL